MSTTETDPEFAQYSAAFVEETLRHASIGEHDLLRLDRRDRPVERRAEQLPGRPVS
ncbi:hypothetical protein IAE22_37425, partial [Bacillus sp. S34]|nr:hypothetical protein [Bacillus sp. S34]